MGHVLSKLSRMGRPEAQQSTEATHRTPSLPPDTNPSTGKRYKYSSLPNGSIRILALLPADDPTTPLQCQLINHQLRGTIDQPDLFEALSYVWGSSETPHSISIGPNATLAITASLHAALLCLRGRSIQRFIWIDAVCINQEELDERANQIRLMAEIYSRASRVVIWLGENEDGGEKALESLRATAALANIRDEESGSSTSDGGFGKESEVSGSRGNDGYDVYGGYDKKTVDGGDDEGKSSSGWSSIDDDDDDDDDHDDHDDNDDDDDEEEGEAEDEVDEEDEEEEEAAGGSSDESSDSADEGRGGFPGALNNDENKAALRKNDGAGRNFSVGDGDNLEAGFDHVEEERLILFLLGRPWFQRIWVLQEAGAAHHILVKCGTAEIDGYTFFLGLQKLQSYFKSSIQRVRSPAPVIDLIGGSIFRPKSRHTQSLGEVSLDIRPFHELLDMYRAHKATDPRDKIFALLGMSSDLPAVNDAGIIPNYTISWDNLLHHVINFVLKSHVPIETMEKQDGMAIRGMGYVLGKVTVANEPDDSNVGQLISIRWKGGKRPSKPRRFPALAIRIRTGDIACQLVSCDRVMLIRPRQSLDSTFSVVVIAFPVDDEPQATRAMAVEKDAGFQHSFDLMWEWRENADHKATPQQSSEIQAVGLEQPVKLFSAALILEDSGSYQASCRRFQVAAERLKLAQEPEPEWEETRHLIEQFRRARICTRSQLGSIGLPALSTRETNQMISNRGERLLIAIAELREEMADAVGVAKSDNGSHKKQLMRHAVKMRAQAQGRNHPDTLAVREKLALLEGTEQSGTRGAESWFQLVEDRIRTQGADHPDVAISFDRFMSLAETSFSKDWGVLSRWTSVINMILGREAITEEKVAAVVQLETPECLALLFEQSRAPVTDRILEAAEQNFTYGARVVKLLLGLREARKTKSPY